MVTETYSYKDIEVELEYLDRDGAFWPNKFQVRVPVVGGAEWQGEQYSQTSFPTKEECLKVMKRDAMNFIDRL